MLVDQDRQHKATLKMGEHKSFQTDRVVLVPGPKLEIKIVRWIYQAFVTEGKMESEIAAALNVQGTLTDFGRAWTRGTVHQVLTLAKPKSPEYRREPRDRVSHIESPKPLG
jgi:hypothetical protein